MTRKKQRPLWLQQYGSRSNALKAKAARENTARIRKMIATHESSTNVAAIFKAAI